jgi:SAM-dependent methyltransferase
VLPHLAALAPQARCAGCDVDQAAIAWAIDHRPEFRWSVNQYRPPLPFESESFELVYSISVFSHLDQALQDQWLSEIGRVMAPDGMALLSVHGRDSFDDFRSGRAKTAWCRPDAFARGPLNEDEFVFEPYRRSVWNAAELPGVGVDYGLAFHGPGYIRERWSRAFEVIGVLERGIAGWQDVVVCRKRSHAGQLPSATLS